MQEDPEIEVAVQAQAPHKSIVDVLHRALECSREAALRAKRWFDNLLRAGPAIVHTDTR